MTVTVNAPVVDGVHERVAVPDPVKLVGARMQASPVEGLTEKARLTTPANPFKLVTDTVDVPAWPTLTVTLVGLTAMLKSGEFPGDTVTIWELVAVCCGLPASLTIRVTMYVPPEA